MSHVKFFCESLSPNLNITNFHQSTAASPPFLARLQPNSCNLSFSPKPLSISTYTYHTTTSKVAMAPAPPAPLPVADNYASLTNRISLSIASRSSVLKNMNSSITATPVRRRVIPDDNDDDLREAQYPTPESATSPRGKTYRNMQTQRRRGF
ncbi:hypothetical protein NXS19_010513 [Fusarium pseudograminearum]|nr:hypothetical protein NXS19_010513 [Fusarium pseudograminearum]